MNPLVVANWKLNGDAAFVAEWIGRMKRLLADAGDVEVVACPPAAYLSQARELLRGTCVTLGAQDVSDRERGAYTGEVSARMLKDVGCEWVIVGHSERRALYHEDDAWVAAKFRAALAAGLVPIVCVGETSAQREAGEAERVVAAQLAVLSPRDGASGDARWVVAYEPLWAIGAGRAAEVGQIVEMHALIRAHVGSPSVRVIYGGSINADNAASLFGADGVEGGLVGGASLDAESFCRVCAAANPVK